MLRISVWGNLLEQRWLHQSPIGLESSCRGSLPFLLLGEHERCPVSKNPNKPHKQCFSKPSRHKWLTIPEFHHWKSPLDTNIAISCNSAVALPCTRHKSNDPTWQTWLTTPLIRWVRCVIYSVPKASISSCFSLLIFYLSCQLSPVPINCKLNKYGITELHSLSFSLKCLTWAKRYKKGNAASRYSSHCARLCYLSYRHQNHPFIPPIAHCLENYW